MSELDEKPGRGELSTDAVEAVCKPSLTKSVRRTKADVQRLCQTMYDLLKAEHPMTVRQVFYRLVSMEEIAKKESEYKNTVDRLLVRMRLAKEVPFGWIADNTRWMRKPRTFDSLEEALQNTARTYRRALWTEQDVYCEVWLENPEGQTTTPGSATVALPSRSSSALS